MGTAHPLDLKPIYTCTSFHNILKISDLVHFCFYPLKMKAEQLITFWLTIGLQSIRRKDFADQTTIS